MRLGSLGLYTTPNGVVGHATTDSNAPPRHVPGHWTEAKLTEPWAEYRARKQAERAGR